MKDLITIENKDILISKPELLPMIADINTALPEISRATENFGKRQSQMMDNLLTVHHPTPLRNMRQIAAEIEKTMGALKEGHFKSEKKRIEIAIKQRDVELETRDLERSLILLEIDEMHTQMADSEKYISGAVRKIRNYTEQYNSIMAKVMEEQGITEFSEIDFEREEEAYHIMTVFSQARNSMLTRGVIDEGNQIYLQQLGINGHVALQALTGLQMLEKQMMQEGKEPDNQMVLDFLKAMTVKFKGCTTKIQEHKGMTTFTAEAAISPKLLEK